jgi:hypothetical protein
VELSPFREEKRRGGWSGHISAEYTSLVQTSYIYIEEFSAA